MENTTDLFGEGDHSLSASAPIARWQLVTNQRNLLFMLAAGMIMPPKAFGNKYYQDTLSAFPGWIPLFADAVPKAAIEHSVSERSHLIPCIASFDLSLIRGKVLAVGLDGEVRETIFPDEFDVRERFLLIPAPLPVSCLTSIEFQSHEERSKCEQDASDFENVPLQQFARKVRSSAFLKATGEAWPPTSKGASAIDIPLDVPLSAGAMMAMLLHMANRGDILMQASKLAFEPETDVAGLNGYPIVSALGEWMQTDQLGHSIDVAKTLFWGMVDKVAACRSSDGLMTPLDAAIGYLESSNDKLDDRKRQAGTKLVDDIRTLAGFADRTITEMFERHTKPLSRAMTLFTLREKCADLLEFKHPLLVEQDYIAAAILFSAREGWLGLPIDLRDFPGLQEAVSHRMAAMAHRIAKTGVDLGTVPPRPKSLRELLAPGSKGWNKTQKEAAVLLAKECKWDCIQTRVSLGKGDYRLVIDGSGVHFLLDGEAKAVVTEVDHDKFFSHLAQTPISSKLDRKIRKLLKV